MFSDVLLDTFTTMLEVALIVVIPAAAAFFGKILRDFLKVYSKKVNNEYVTAMFDSITGTVEAAVTSTTQTYVMERKARNGFGVDEQIEAMKRTISAAKGLLNKEAQDLIRKTHGDLDFWLWTQAESFVHDHGLIDGTPVAAAE